MTESTWMGPMATARRGVLVMAMLGTAAPVWAQATRPVAPAAPTAAASAAPGQVVVSGVVPDEATRVAILGKVRELYGAQRVVDQLGIGPLVAPPNWAALVQRMLTPEIKRVSDGQLRVSGNIVEVTGTVPNEAMRQQLASTLVNQIGNPTWTVRNGLQAGRGEQQVLDHALANRIIEFEPGNARLTAAGARVLEDLLPILQSMSGRRFEVVGHTDADGVRAKNIALSEARAAAVKAWLVARGVAAASILTTGAGPDRPVADNATAEGRARNRRIEFRVLA